jgi:hypothetical protein
VGTVTFHGTSFTLGLWGEGFLTNYLVEMKGKGKEKVEKERMNEFRHE